MDRYYIHKEHIIGQSEEPESDYDLMEVIMIRRGSNTGADAIFDYLSGVFNSDIRKISDYTDTKDNEEVTTMGGLGASIAQEASIRQLIEAYRDFNASDEEIIKKLMSKFGISEDIAKDYIKKFELQPV